MSKIEVELEINSVKIDTLRLKNKCATPAMLVVEADYYPPTQTQDAKIRVKIVSQVRWFPYDEDLDEDNQYLLPIVRCLKCRILDIWRGDKELNTLLWKHTPTGMIALATVKNVENKDD